MRFLKFFVLLNIVLLCSSSPLLLAQKGRLYAILAAETANANTGAGHSANLKRMKAEVDTISYMTGMLRKTHLVEGADYSLAKIQAKIAECKLTAQDVLILYVSGSELITRSRENPSNLIDFPDNYADYHNLTELLTAAKPRLGLVLVDLCNSVGDLSPIFIEKGVKERYVSLFVQSSGMVEIINHFPKEQAESKIGTYGSIFTGSFLQALHENTEPVVQWSNIVSRSRFLTVRNSSGGQNPQAMLNISQQPDSRPFNSFTGDDLGKPDLLKKTDPTAANETSTDRDKTENLDQEEDSKINFFRNEASDKVQLLLEKISALAKGSSTDSQASNEASVIEEVMALFSDNNREIEISNLFRRKSRRKVNKYFSSLYGVGKEYNVSIDWYKPLEMGEFQKMASGSYIAKAQIFQEFRKTDREGKLIYGDRVTKTVEVLLIPSDLGDSGYRVAIGNITVVDGSTEPINE
ncbi:MAG: hypothetical protein EAZ67_11935 [Cytophagales bacterium]|nr:MAG: hypothetical protein EAZ67_11935 [Cytophagales bacterium]